MFQLCGDGLPVFNQYLARINVFYSRKEHSDAGEAFSVSVSGVCNFQENYYVLNNKPGLRVATPLKYQASSYVY